MVSVTPPEPHTLESPPERGAAAAAGGDGARKALRLLLVEDSAGDARLLREMIAEQAARGLEVAHVETMEAAERHLSLGAFEVVVVDLGRADRSR